MQIDKRIHQIYKYDTKKEFITIMDLSFVKRPTAISEYNDEEIEKMRIECGIHKNYFIDKYDEFAEKIKKSKSCIAKYAYTRHDRILKILPKYNNYIINAESHCCDRLLVYIGNKEVLNIDLVDDPLEDDGGIWENIVQKLIMRRD